MVPSALRPTNAVASSDARRSKLRTVWMAFESTTGGALPSPEVLKKSALAAVAPTNISVEHIWVEASVGTLHVVVFLSVTSKGIPREIGEFIGKGVEADLPSVVFRHCRQVDLRNFGNGPS